MPAAKKGESTAAPFNPEEHLRNLKGQKYLEVKWRIVWYNEERASMGGSIRCVEVMHDPTAGVATFHSVASYWDYITPAGGGEGRWIERVGEGNGSETRKDFSDYYEKAATKAIGRALANLGYGTQFAIELDEQLDRPGGSPADAPVAGRGKEAPSLQEQIQTLLAHDIEGAEKLPKTLEEMTEVELTKTLTWLTKRKRDGLNVEPAVA